MAVRRSARLRSTSAEVSDYPEVSTMDVPATPLGGLHNQLGVN